MLNQNGEVILKVLAKVGEPMTLDNIVMYISARARVPPQEISETVRKTLNGGVQFGFVQKWNGEYYAQTGGMGQGTGRRRCMNQKSKGVHKTQRKYNKVH